MVKRRYSILCVMFAILIGFSSIAFSQQTTYAKEKVTKVTYTTKMKNDKECMIVKGLSSKKKTIWSYKTPYRVLAQCSTFKCIVKKNRVYVFDYLRLLILNKSNGKRLYTVKNTPERGHFATVTNKYNCYEIGYIGNNSGRLYKISPKGKIIYESAKISKYSYGWPTSIKVSGKYVYVGCYKFNGQPKPVTIKFNEKNGKFLGEK